MAKEEQLVESLKEQEHALLSASGASRWLNCTASARYEEPFPDSTSDFAEEGTLAHSLGELQAKQRLGQITSEEYEKEFAEIRTSKYYCEEMLEYMKGYGDFIYESVKNASTTVSRGVAELEVRLDFSKWVPEGFGTGDCIIVGQGHLEVIDLKYGKGVRVSGEDNSQMKLYALGALARFDLIFDIKNVKMCIYQPRLDSISTYEMSVEDLLQWAEKEVIPKAREAFDGTGAFAPSETACKWCRGKKQCGARASSNQEIMLQHFREDSVAHLTPDDAGFILSQAKDIKKWLDDLEKYVNECLMQNIPVDGWKLVEGRSNRVYTDPDAVKVTLEKANIPPESYIETKLLTISNLEKKLGKKQVAVLLGDLVEKPKGKPTLVPSSDKREPMNQVNQVIEMFQDDYQY